MGWSPMHGIRTHRRPQRAPGPLPDEGAGADGVCGGRSRFSPDTDLPRPGLGRRPQNREKERLLLEPPDGRCVCVSGQPHFLRANCPA